MCECRSSISTRSNDLQRHLQSLHWTTIHSRRAAETRLAAPSELSTAAYIEGMGDVYSLATKQTNSCWTSGLQYSGTRTTIHEQTVQTSRSHACTAECNSHLESAGLRRPLR